MTRLFFITDVHASDRCFRKFLNAAKFYDADCLVLGGDITGKVLIPIIEGNDGTYTLRLFERDSTVGKDRLKEIQKALLDTGQYSFVTTPKELEELQADKSKEERVFNEAMGTVLKSWIELADERLKGTTLSATSPRETTTSSRSTHCLPIRGI